MCNEPRLSYVPRYREPRIVHVRTEADVRAYPVPCLGLLDEQHTVDKVEEPLIQAMKDSRATGRLGGESHSLASYKQVLRWDLQKVLEAQNSLSQGKRTREKGHHDSRKDIVPESRGSDKALKC